MASAIEQDHLGGGKIGGAAQKGGLSGAVLPHVPMSYDMDLAKLGEVLRGWGEVVGTGVASAWKRVNSLRWQTRLSRE